jgi:hypothetical protein
MDPTDCVGMPSTSGWRQPSVTDVAVEVDVDVVKR